MSQDDIVDRLRRASKMPIPPVMLLSEAADAIELARRNARFDAATWRDRAFETAAEIVERWFPSEGAGCAGDIRALKRRPIV